MWHQIFTWCVGIWLIGSYVVPVVLTPEGPIERGFVTAMMLLYMGCYMLDVLWPPNIEPDRPLHAPLKQRYRSASLERMLSMLYPY